MQQRNVMTYLIIVMAALVFLPTLLPPLFEIVGGVLAKIVPVLLGGVVLLLVVRLIAVSGRAR